MHVKVDQYLWKVVGADPNHEKEIRRRICIGCGALGQHPQIMNNRLPLSLERMAHNQCVLSVMSCGAETAADGDIYPSCCYEARI